MHLSVRRLRLRAALLLPLVTSLGALRADVSLEQLGPAHVGQRAEWRVAGGPVTANNFDPDVVRVDATVTAPSGRALTIPAFWFQDFTRALADGAQVLTPRGAPEWRFRFTPEECGEHRVSLAIVETGRDPSSTATPPVATTFTAAPPPAGAAPYRGRARVGADRRSFATADGQPLRLTGANVCWGGPRGTYDYDAWLPAWRAAGANVARLWLSPWSMGLEHTPGTLNRYDLAAAWHADHVLRLAEEQGLYVLLALDHHGMFMADDPAWGGSNNFWTRSSPYAVENGGPCANPNEFFTLPAARRLYEKRLRYLVARWGGSPHLLAWQFFNEIDNAYRPRSALVGDDVVDWHRDLGRRLRAHDPYGHLISTSLTGASDRPEIWSLPEMDFVVYHSYGEADPARYVARVTADLARRYDKPVMIGEIGTNHLGWQPQNDPHLRGFRQGLWGGALGGPVGTSLAWWWEDIHADRAYPLYAVLGDVLTRAGWHEGNWTPVVFADFGDAPLALDAPAVGAEPFSAAIPLNQLRLNRVSGEAALADPLAAARAAERISSYLHGARNPHLQRHARFTAWFAARAKLVFRVNSVAADADLLVRIDGEEKLRAPLVNRDGLATLNDEIDREFTVEVPAGKHTVELAHTGVDWVNLKALRFERLLPAPFAGGWRFRAEAVGLRRERTAVVYVRSPHVAWPAGATRFNPPEVRDAVVTLRDWPGGESRVEWYDPRDGRVVAKTAASASTDARLPLVVPPFNDDLVAIVRATDP